MWRAAASRSGIAHSPSFIVQGLQFNEVWMFHPVRAFLSQKEPKAWVLILKPALASWSGSKSISDPDQPSFNLNLFLFSPDRPGRALVFHS